MSFLFSNELYYDHTWIMMLEDKPEERHYIIDQMIILENEGMLKQYIKFVLSLEDDYNIYKRLELLLEEHFPRYLDFYHKAKLLT